MKFIMENLGPILIQSSRCGDNSRLIQDVVIILSTNKSPLT